MSNRNWKLNNDTPRNKANNNNNGKPKQKYFLGKNETENAIHSINWKIQTGNGTNGTNETKKVDGIKTSSLSDEDKVMAWLSEGLKLV
ncbi:unnamed protein product [Ambrosiozyma monospora]|uniref:Unnamed protein product n=1 Tax=Ambrosiozyma monospora TaxID=43982 RepID=A0A9W6YZ85_AMBMO|nr:unnamed protein product [Ambrosiozyma monospora]